jgi:hypothetical protein
MSKSVGIEFTSFTTHISHNPYALSTPYAPRLSYILHPTS